MRLIQFCLCLREKDAQEQSAGPGFHANCAVERTRLLGDLIELDRLKSYDRDYLALTILVVV